MLRTREILGSNTVSVNQGLRDFP